MLRDTKNVDKEKYLEIAQIIFLFLKCQTHIYFIKSAMTIVIKDGASPKRRFVIGDVHGCADTLSYLLFEKMKVKRKDKIYFLGDLIDRGPNSKKVLDIIFDLLFRGYRVRCIRGNHEVMALNALKSDKAYNHWLKHGGKVMLKSFRANHIQEIESAYIRFFRSMPYFVEEKDFFLVHGGFNFAITDPLKDKELMPWTRGERPDLTKLKGKRYIVGHTPVPLTRVSHSLTSQRIMLDGGCVYRNYVRDLGYLCGLELNEMELFVQLNIDKQ